MQLTGQIFALGSVIVNIPKLYSSPRRLPMQCFIIEKQSNHVDETKKMSLSLRFAFIVRLVFVYVSINSHVGTSANQY